MTVTLSDIAARAEVSVATVSNVLRGKGKASLETENRVIKIARDLGYFEHSRVRTGLLGVISCTMPDAFTRSRNQDSSPMELASYFTAEALEGIEDVASRSGRHIILQTLPTPTTDWEIPSMVKERLVEGVVVIGGTVPDDLILALQSRAIPLVLLFTRLKTEPVNCILADNYQGALSAVRELIRRGHQRIGIVNGWKATHTSEDKLAGFREGLREGGLEFDHSLYTEGDFTFEGGYQQAQLLLNVPGGAPTGLFVADDMMALGAIKAIKDAGLRVPEDVAVVGFGDSGLGANWDPPLSTVSIPKRQMGAMAVERLLELCQGEDDKTLTIMVSPKLNLRGSC
ncbi:MAG: LacI family transcriptional regulator [Firmicutes bacterium]|nr:LacI family transcriptional regulator [Bacillota bacterium]